MGRILIVDDDRNVRDILRIVFETEGYEIVGEAANGLEAVRMATDVGLDFIILDRQMPELDGDSTATVLRAIAPTAKIVAFSSHLDARPEWADGYLSKDRMNDLTPLLETLARV